MRKIALVIRVMLALEVVTVVEPDLAVIGTIESEIGDPIDAKAFAVQVGRAIIADPKRRPPCSGLPAVFPEDGFTTCNDTGHTISARSRFRLVSKMLQQSGEACIYSE